MPVREAVATEQLLEEETRTLQAVLANRKDRYAYVIAVVVDRAKGPPGLIKTSMLLKAHGAPKGDPEGVVVTVAEALMRAANELLDRARRLEDDGA